MAARVATVMAPPGDYYGSRKTDAVYERQVAASAGVRCRFHSHDVATFLSGKTPHEQGTVQN